MALLATVAALLAAHHHQGCTTAACEQRVDRLEHRRTVRRWAHATRPYDAKLERMAWCESRGRWWIATGNGYYGGLQFDAPTWRSVGGRSLPHLHTALEQKFRAVLLIRRRGYGPWPVCGRA